MRSARRWPSAGEPVTVLPFAVGHVCYGSELCRIVAARGALGGDHPQSVDPLGYVGWSVTHAFVLALIALGLGGGWPAAAARRGRAGLSRRVCCCAIERAYGLPAHPYWLIPLRELLSGCRILARVSSPAM